MILFVINFGLFDTSNGPDLIQLSLFNFYIFLQYFHHFLQHFWPFKCFFYFNNFVSISINFSKLQKLFLFVYFRYFLLICVYVFVNCWVVLCSFYFLCLLTYLILFSIFACIFIFSSVIFIYCHYLHFIFTAFTP